MPADLSLFVVVSPFGPAMSVDGTLPCMRCSDVDANTAYRLGWTLGFPATLRQFLAVVNNYYQMKMNCNWRRVCETTANQP
jgi:hypothetical protein